MRAARSGVEIVSRWLKPASGVVCRVTIRRIVNRFLAINRVAPLFTAFATAATIGGLVGSPAGVADDDPAPPPPAPEPARADAPEIPSEEPHCVYIDIINPCEIELSPQLPDTPRTPDGP